MLSICSKRRIKKHFMTINFNGDWNNAYLYDGDKEFGSLKLDGKIVLLEDLNLKFPLESFYNLLDASNSSFLDLLQICINVKKVSSERTIIERFVRKNPQLVWDEFYSTAKHRYFYYAYML